MEILKHALQLDPSIDENFFGYVTSAYSVGQIVSAPIVGFWATKTKSILNPSQFSLFFVFIGNAVYFTAPLWSQGRKWVVFVGRLMAGVGAGRVFWKKAFKWFWS